MKRDDFFNKNENITMITCYDFQNARIASQTDVDILLVGDSLGMVFQGKDSTREVTIDQMCYHTECVRKGAPDKFIVSDLPFHVSSDANLALEASQRLVKAGADSVKIEGFDKQIFHTLTSAGIKVTGHSGLLPQTAENYRVKGKGDQRQEVIDESVRIAEAGACMLVLECIPESLGREITETVSIPTIGIGAGRYCSGEVLVITDMLGIGNYRLPRFVKKYAELENQISDAINNYVNEVKSGKFPAEEHIYR